jgi:hypothetical protein
MVLCHVSAEIKELRSAGMAANQANVQQTEEARRYRVKAAAVMMWINAISRLIFLMVGNSWPMVLIAHGVGFTVEIAEVLVKYRVEGEITLGMPLV